MRVLITGATGFLGKHLVPKLDFCDVRCLVRRTSDISSIKLKNIEFFYGDITNKDSLDKAMKGIDIVIHMAASVWEKDKEKQYKINVDGTRNVIDVCRKNKIKKIIYLSTVAVIFGKEDSNYNYSFTKRKAEQIVLKAKLNSIVLRPSLIYGKGSRLTKILKIVRRLPIVALPAHMLKKKIQQPVYVKDVIDVIIKAVESDKLKTNKPYFIAGPKSHTVAEIIDQITIYPFKPLKIKIPTWFIKILFAIYQKIVTGTPIQKEHLSKQRRVYYFDNIEAKKDFGYNPLDISDVIKLKEGKI